MPYKNVIEAYIQIGPDNGDSDTFRAERRGDRVEVKFWTRGTKADQHSPTATFRVTLRELCEELGILPGDVPADMGYRGY